MERDKIELSNQLSSTNSALTKYREEKSVGMKDKYIKEMKDFIDGLQLKDPEVKNSMHARMEDLAKQGIIIYYLTMMTTPLFFASLIHPTMIR